MSTELALLTQKEVILQGFEEKKLTLGIFVDFSKAFDRINHRTLFSKLEYYGFRGLPLSLLQSYLKHRKQAVEITNKLSSLENIAAGVPQGSILGPILFNLYINDIVKISNDAQFVIFADDSSMFVRAHDVQELSRLANSTLQKMHTWSIANSLEINTKKLNQFYSHLIKKQLTIHLICT